MTHPPNAPAAPAAPGPARAPARPAGVPAQPAAAPAAAPAAGRGAWAVGRERLRVATTTEPGRLQILGAVLALLVVAFGAVTALQVDDRATAADDVVSRSQPLSADAAAIYRSLADADTTAASGFLAGTLEPEESRKRYDRDIATAARLLVKAAASTDGSGESAREIATLNEQLPRYTGLIERARAANRQGLPLGGAYLRYASQQMTSTLLPAAERLYAAETVHLQEDDESARTWPFLSLGLGLLVLAALVWAQRRNYTRTHRVFNHGLLAASAAAVVVVLWLLAAHTIARAGLDSARAHGQESLQVLNSARISSLTARANENLTLVARGAVLTEDGKNDKYEAEYTSSMGALTDALATAREWADDDAGRGPVDEAATRTAEWKQRHKDARAKDEAGDFDGALGLIVGSKESGRSTGQSFDQVDAALERALAHEQAEFTRSAADARDALTALPLGAAALGILGAAGAVLGINRRLSEYR
ncbi:hypothetical protein [Streptomyces zaomyceticus]|uniref:hypothetical protein n=1 Tax=Streptomyces zaomyceticus TaxID=68286 RepID=UPI0016761B9F|nr:hypothetical protein [Streptomyces zaomyceticus]GHF95722.1 hypothetical protein GCM10018791_03160 [Streptomyces zaomyceticus]